MGLIFKPGNKGSSFKRMTIFCLVLGITHFAQGCVTVPKETDPKYARLKLIHVEEMTQEEFSYFLDKSKNGIKEDSWRWKKAMGDAMRLKINSSHTDLGKIPEGHLISYELGILESLNGASNGYNGDDIDLLVTYLIKNESVERRDNRLLKVYYKMFSPSSGPIHFIYSKDVYLSALEGMNRDSKFWGDNYQKKLPYIFEASYQYLRLFADNIRDFKRNMGDQEQALLRNYRDQVMKNFYDEPENRHYKNAKEVTRKLDPIAYKRVYFLTDN